jgi:Flp pilus assembly protein TadG
MIRTRRPHERDKGQAMTEFALVAPVFFLLIFSVIELGILFGGQNGLVGAARELARYAAPYRVKTVVDATQVCADTRLGTQLTNALKQDVVGYSAVNMGVRSITYSWHPNADGTTYYVQLEVDISYHFPLHVPLVGNLIDRGDGISDNKLLLDAKEQMRIENEDYTAAQLQALDPTWTPASTTTCTV